MVTILVALLTFWLLLTTLTDIENNIMGKVIPLILCVWGVLFVVKSLGYLKVLLSGLNFILT